MANIGKYATRGATRGRTKIAPQKAQIKANYLQSIRKQTADNLKEIDQMNQLVQSGIQLASTMGQNWAEGQAADSFAERQGYTKDDRAWYDVMSDDSYTKTDTAGNVYQMTGKEMTSMSKLPVGQSQKYMQDIIEQPTSPHLQSTEMSRKFETVMQTVDPSFKVGAESGITVQDIATGKFDTDNEIFETALPGFKDKWKSFETLEGEEFIQDFTSQLEKWGPGSEAPGEIQFDRVPGGPLKESDIYKPSSSVRSQIMKTADAGLSFTGEYQIAPEGELGPSERQIEQTDAFGTTTIDPETGEPKTLSIEDHIMKTFEETEPALGNVEGLLMPGDMTEDMWENRQEGRAIRERQLLEQQARDKAREDFDFGIEADIDMLRDAGYTEEEIDAIQVDILPEGTFRRNVPGYEGGYEAWRAQGSKPYTTSIKDMLFEGSGSKEQKAAWESQMNRLLMAKDYLDPEEAAMIQDWGTAPTWQGTEAGSKQMLESINTMEALWGEDFVYSDVYQGMFGDTPPGNLSTEDFIKFTQLADQEAAVLERFKIEGIDEGGWSPIPFSRPSEQDAEAQRKLLRETMVRPDTDLYNQWKKNQNIGTLSSLGYITGSK